LSSLRNSFIILMSLLNIASSKGVYLKSGLHMGFISEIFLSEDIMLLSSVKLLVITALCRFLLFI